MGGGFISGRQETVSVDRLKPHLGLAPGVFGRSPDSADGRRTDVHTVTPQLLILLWRSFIYEEISEWNVNKSANCLDIYAPKVE